MEDRIETYLDAGYEFVPATAKNEALKHLTVDASKGLDGRVSRPAGRSDPRRLYLMQLPKKFYTEDQLAKQREVDATEETMHKPTKGKRSKDVTNLDSPDYGNISLTRKNKPDRIPNDDD